jgi:small subunit ribosomal protein S8e
MAITQHRSKRKASGGRYKSHREKRVYEIGEHPILTQVGTSKAKTTRGVGGNLKRKLQSSDSVNLTENGKSKKAKVLSVVNNPANQNYTRRNIITKGCIIETSEGNVKITSRPGQDGNLNGVKVQ